MLRSAPIGLFDPEPIDIRRTRIVEHTRAGVKEPDLGTDPPGLRGQYHHPCAPPCCRRAGEKRGQAAQGLGRCRGGFSTKIHLACADERTPVAVLLTPGQDAEAPTFPELWDQVKQQAQDVEEAVADKAYDSDELRGQLIEDNVLPIIPKMAR